MKRVWEFEGTPVRVIDGDTYIFNIDLGFRVYTEVNIRIKDINAPEIKGKEKELGFIARDYVIDLFSKTETFFIRTEYDKTFDRYLGHVLVDGIDLAELLVSKGYAIRA